jgi:hypothetical protein
MGQPIVHGRTPPETGEVGVRFPIGRIGKIHSSRRVNKNDVPAPSNILSGLIIRFLKPNKNGSKSGGRM